MSVLRTAGAGFIVIVLFVLPAHASQSSRVVTGYVEFMSMYVGRGLSQSVGEPSVQGELDLYTSSGFYAGVDGTSINWVDQLYPGDSVSLEIDLYAGYRKRVGYWTFKGGVLRLLFPGKYVAQDPPAERPDTTEVFGFVGWRWFGVKLNYAITNAFGTPDSRGSWYLDLAADFPLQQGWSLGAHVGRKQPRGIDPATGLANDRFSYTDYRLSVGKALTRDTGIGLDYVWTNADPTFYTLNGYNVAGRHFVLTLTTHF